MQVDGHHSEELFQAPGVPGTLLGWLRLWFLLRDPVGRRAYALSGFGLMALKYAVELSVLLLLTGLFYSPFEFVNPMVSTRQRFLVGLNSGISMIWVAWTLPFLWIALSMSVRRALDGGISPWHGLWILVPFLNLLAMLLLVCLPTSATDPQSDGTARPTFQPPQTGETATTLWAMIGGIGVGALFASVIVQLSVYVLKDYGATLFFGTPFITGLASSYLFNLRASRSWSGSFAVAAASVALCGLGMLLFALEGVICLVMAAPIVLPLGMFGAPLGKFLVDRRRGLHREFIGALLVVPLLATVEAQFPAGDEFVVVSSIDIAAPPAEVWRQVIAFPEITERPEWFFRLGISCPTGARISGSGVGATRECLFTTGTFVEPITAWDEPRRLAFDVREQPAPMFELTPYRHIHPPHLDGAFLSTRGEFELLPLPDGGTRLTGRTWYTLDIRPHTYWTIWTDWIIHRIHMRVLRHIKQVAEGSG